MIIQKYIKIFNPMTEIFKKLSLAFLQTRNIINLSLVLASYIVLITINLKNYHILLKSVVFIGISAAILKFFKIVYIFIASYNDLIETVDFNITWPEIMSNINSSITINDVLFIVLCSIVTISLQIPLLKSLLNSSYTTDQHDCNIYVALLAISSVLLCTILYKTYKTYLKHNSFHFYLLALLGFVDFISILNSYFIWSEMLGKNPPRPEVEKELHTENEVINYAADFLMDSYSSDNLGEMDSDTKNRITELGPQIDELVSKNQEIIKIVEEKKKIREKEFSEVQEMISGYGLNFLFDNLKKRDPRAMTYNLDEIYRKADVALGKAKELKVNFSSLSSDSKLLRCRSFFLSFNEIIKEIEHLGQISKENKNSFVELIESHRNCNSTIKFKRDVAYFYNFKEQIFDSVVYQQKEGKKFTFNSQEVSDIDGKSQKVSDIDMERIENFIENSLIKPLINSHSVYSQNNSKIETSQCLERTKKSEADISKAEIKENVPSLFQTDKSVKQILNFENIKSNLNVYHSDLNSLSLDYSKPLNDNRDWLNVKFESDSFQFDSFFDSLCKFLSDQERQNSLKKEIESLLLKSNNEKWKTHFEELEDTYFNILNFLKDWVTMMNESKSKRFEKPFNLTSLNKSILQRESSDLHYDMLKAPVQHYLSYGWDDVENDTPLLKIIESTEQDDEIPVTNERDWYDSITFPCSKDKVIEAYLSFCKIRKVQKKIEEDLEVIKALDAKFEFFKKKINSDWINNSFETSLKLVKVQHSDFYFQILIFDQLVLYFSEFLNSEAFIQARTIFLPVRMKIMNCILTFWNEIESFRNNFKGLISFMNETNYSLIEMDRKICLLIATLNTLEEDERTISSYLENYHDLILL